MLFCFILVYTYKELYDIVEKTNKKTQCYTQTVHTITQRAHLLNFFGLCNGIETKQTIVCVVGIYARYLKQASFCVNIYIYVCVCVCCQTPVCVCCVCVHLICVKECVHALGYHRSGTLSVHQYYYYVNNELMATICQPCQGDLTSTFSFILCLCMYLCVCSQTPVHVCCVCVHLTSKSTCMCKRICKRFGLSQVRHTKCPSVLHYPQSIIH